MRATALLAASVLVGTVSAAPPCEEVSAASFLRGVGGVEIHDGSNLRYLRAVPAAGCSVTVGGNEYVFRKDSSGRHHMDDVTLSFMKVSLSKGASSVAARSLPAQSCAATACVDNVWASGAWVKKNAAGFDTYQVCNTNPLDYVADACYCDDACTKFKDCCGDYQETCVLGYLMRVNKQTTYLGDTASAAPASVQGANGPAVSVSHGSETAWLPLDVSVKVVNGKAAEPFHVRALFTVSRDSIKQQCAGDTPITCWGANVGYSCAATREDCGATVVCPPHLPVLCWYSGFCVKDLDHCSQTCQNETPYRCPEDGACARDASSCAPAPPRGPGHGALVKVTWAGKVGVQLDDAPPGTFRDKVASYYASQSQDFWYKKAMLQSKMMEYRGVFRAFYYPDRPQLTLPPENLWKFEFGTPAREIIDGHDLLVMPYTQESYLFGTLSSLAESEEALAFPGGNWSDSWALPVDESQLLQRTAYDCMDEIDFPPDSVDSENTWVYYDDFCSAEDADFSGDGLACHVTEGSDRQRACVDSLAEFIGKQTVDVVWEHVAWDPDLANKWRWPPSLDELVDGTDMRVSADGAKDYRVFWRFIKEDGCQLDPSENSCADKPGWRKMLTFSSSIINYGKNDFFNGIVSPESVWVKLGIYEYSACHKHSHSQHYGSFFYGEKIGRKTSFCIQSTWRYLNNEYTDFWSRYGSCALQGVTAGWGDDYKSGLQCQWLDITEQKPGVHKLIERHNPSAVLCEGTPERNAQGELQFETIQLNPSGKLQNKMACKLNEGFADNNYGEEDAVNPEKGGSFVTLPCSNHQFGGRRNCGFKFVVESNSCTPGTQVNLNITVDDSTPISVRVCEFSIREGFALACEWNRAVASVDTVVSTGEITFTCPGARDAVEVGGKYGVLAAPLLEIDTLPAVAFSVAAAANPSP